MHRKPVAAAFAAVLIAGASMVHAQADPSPTDTKAPDVAVLQGETPIAPGGTDSLGNVSVGTVSRTYTIANNGNSSLGIVGVNNPFNLVNVSKFAVTANPTLTSVPPGGSTDFTIQFDVDANGPFGLDLAVLNGDTQKAAYVISPSGTGIGGEPQIGLSLLTFALKNGASDLVGDVLVGTVIRTYTIANTGAGDLQLDTINAVNLSNVDNFSVTTPPATTLAPGTSTNLTFQFDVVAKQPYSFELQVANDDNDANPYSVTLKGTGVSKPGG